MRSNIFHLISFFHFSFLLYSRFLFWNLCFPCFCLDDLFFTIIWYTYKVSYNVVKFPWDRACLEYPQPMFFQENICWNFYFFLKKSLFGSKCLFKKNFCMNVRFVCNYFIWQTDKTWKSILRGVCFSSIFGLKSIELLERFGQWCVE